MSVSASERANLRGAPVGVNSMNARRASEVVSQNSRTTSLPAAARAASCQ